MGVNGASLTRCGPQVARSQVQASQEEDLVRSGQLGLICVAV